MKLIITMHMENDAFTECPDVEAARILRDLARRIEGHSHFSLGHSEPLVDINGNECGWVDIVLDYRLRFWSSSKAETAI